MKNRRPITLLCVNYKIASKAPANHLLHVLPSIISPDQSCGVRGRNPAVNNRLLHDVISDINHRGLGGAVLSLDQEKAFDRVDWSYLLWILDGMNFGDSFHQWVSILHQDFFQCLGQRRTLGPFFCFSWGAAGVPLVTLALHHHHRDSCMRHSCLSAD